MNIATLTSSTLGRVMRVSLLAALLAALSLVGVSNASAAGPSVCKSTKYGKGCFHPHGDVVTVSDEKSDGVRPSVLWRTSYGRKGHCRLRVGRAARVCNYNMREGERIEFRLGLHGGAGRVTYLPWVGPVVI
jgi:hypothetical protein